MLLKIKSIVARQKIDGKHRYFKMYRLEPVRKYNRNFVEKLLWKNNIKDVAPEDLFNSYFDELTFSYFKGESVFTLSEGDLIKPDVLDLDYKIKLCEMDAFDFNRLRNDNLVLKNSKDEVICLYKNGMMRYELDDADVVANCIPVELSIESLLFEVYSPVEITVGYMRVS